MKTSLGAKTLIYPTPVVVVATYDKAGKANMMTAAWAGVCCSKPPCITVSLRKATYTYSCLAGARGLHRQSAQPKPAGDHGLRGHGLRTGPRQVR